LSKVFLIWGKKGFNYINYINRMKSNIYIYIYYILNHIFKITKLNYLN